MKEVTIENVKARIAQLETAEQIGGRLPISHEFEMACLRALIGKMAIEDDVHGIINLLANNEWAEHCTKTVLGSLLESEITRLYNWRSAPPALEIYNIGETTMRHVFEPIGITDVSNMQAVFDQIESALVDFEEQSKEQMAELYRRNATIHRLKQQAAQAEPDTASVYAHLSDYEKWSTSLENVKHVLNAYRAAMLNQAHEPATDNTAQQFEALSTSAGSGKR